VQNHTKAQAPEGKTRTPEFTLQIVKAMKAAADAGYVIKVELDKKAPPLIDNITPLEEWKRSRDGARGDRGH
jgi:hypothetical protein